MSKKHLSATDLNKVLPKETAEKYKIVNLSKRTSTRINFHKYGTIDFSKLTLRGAERLVHMKADFIELKPIAKPKAKD